MTISKQQQSRTNGHNGHHQYNKSPAQRRQSGGGAKTQQQHYQKNQQQQRFSSKSPSSSSSFHRQQRPDRSSIDPSDRRESRALNRLKKKQNKYGQSNGGGALFEMDERQDPRKFPSHLFEDPQQVAMRTATMMNDETRKKMRRTHADVLMLKKRKRPTGENGENGGGAENGDEDELASSSSDEEEEYNCDIDTENKNIDALLRASRDLLPRRIEFRESSKKDSYQAELKSMKPLNGDRSSATLFEMPVDDTTRGNESEQEAEEQGTDVSTTTNTKTSAATATPNKSTTSTKKAGENKTPTSAKKQQPQNITVQTTSTNTAPKANDSDDSDIENNTPLPKPSTTLYPRHKLLTMLKWKNVGKVGPGFDNLGNTCFMNAALQCLVYTPCLFNYLLARRNAAGAGSASLGGNGQPFVALDAMTNLVRQISESKSSSISPRAFAMNLRAIQKQFRLGRQEDSHEFIINLIDKMEDCILKGYKNKLDKLVKETNAVHQIFGGYLRSQIRSLESNYISNTYDPFVDLSLQLNQVSSVEKALNQFVAADTLDGDNKYKCPLTKKYVKATKRMSIHEAPPVLIMQLKRFNIFGRKISKHVTYGEVLNLAPFMSDKTEPVNYHLHGVLVHAGGSCNSGHYYSYVKASNGVWYEMDDSSRRQVSVSTALKQQAYILFYSRDYSKDQAASLVREFEDGQSSEDDVPSTPVPAKAPQIPTTPVANSPAVLKESTVKTPKSKGKKAKSANPPTPQSQPPVQPKQTPEVKSTPSKDTMPPPSPVNSAVDTEKSSASPSPCLLTKKKLLKMQQNALARSPVSPLSDKPVQPKIAFDPTHFNKMVSTSNYGEEVETWSNQAPAAPKLVPVKPAQTSAKKRSRDDWDRILDAGKMKRVKRRKQADTAQDVARNNAAFQQLQNKKYEQERNNKLQQ